VETARKVPFWNHWNPTSPIQIVILVCLVATLSYFALRLEGALMLHPQTVWPLWPGFALLVPILLLLPQRIWVAVIPAAFAAFVLYDLQVGVPLRSIAWFIPADLAQVLIAALFLSYYFGGIPRLGDANSLAKYLLVVVVIAPSIGAFISAPGIHRYYWVAWRICFFSDALAFVALTPAILSWVSDGRAWLRKPRVYHLEAAALLIGLGFVSYFCLAASATKSSPALLYSLLPFLLWSTLRFESIGISSAMIVVAYVSIWGAVHGRGPFIEHAPVPSVFPLQLFLISTAIPFMVLAALVEQRKQAEEAVLRREKELLEAQRVAQVGSWQWDQETDTVAWSKELYRIAGRDLKRPPPTFKEQTQLYTTESWERLQRAVGEALRTGTPYELDLQMIRSDGSTRWITDRGEALRDDAGRIACLRGTAQDITERKQAGEALRASEEKFRSVFRDAGVGMVIVSPEGRFLAANDAFCECLGYTEEELLQKTVESVTLAEDWPSFSRKLSETLEKGTSFQRVEKHCLHKSGRVVTTESTASLIRGPSGEPRYFVGEVLDITERKLAEEALSSVSRRLIEAQEEERARIARELHDDLGQRMAILQIGLEQLSRDTLGLSSKNRQELRDMTRVSMEVSSSIHLLSHQLHPFKLDTLGLITSLRGLCNEFSPQHNLQVQFVHHDVPAVTSKDITLCLFRIAQEALRNVVKHSGAAEAKVELSGHGDRIDLCISDSGAGFNPKSAEGGAGLGLISMRERLRLVGGQLSVESEPTQGTRVRVRVPLLIITSGVTSEGKARKAEA
jgi:PAS domain S-box-containing protein